MYQALQSVCYNTFCAHYPQRILLRRDQSCLQCRRRECLHALEIDIIRVLPSWSLKGMAHQRSNRKRQEATNRPKREAVHASRPGRICTRSRKSQQNRPPAPAACARVHDLSEPGRLNYPIGRTHVARESTRGATRERKRPTSPGKIDGARRAPAACQSHQPFKA